jgi:hypothetical protein
MMSVVIFRLKLMGGWDPGGRRLLAYVRTEFIAVENRSHN